MDTNTFVILAILITGYVVGGLLIFTTNWLDELWEDRGYIVEFLLMLLYSPVFFIAIVFVCLSEAIKTLKKKKYGTED